MFEVMFAVAMLGFICTSVWCCSLMTRCQRWHSKYLYTKVEADYWHTVGSREDTMDDLIERMLTVGVKNGDLDPSWYDKNQALEWASGEIAKRIKKKKLPPPPPEIAARDPKEDRWDQI
jgi:hypothetical protein